MNAEQSQLPSGMRSTHPVPSACREQAPGAVVRAPIETRRGAVIITRNSLFGKQKSVNLRALRRVCAGFVALVAACGASLPAFAEPVETTDQAAIVRAAHAPRNVSAVAEGPARVALSWQAPLAADTSRITGYGIQFSDDGGASWSVLPTASRRATSFVHTVGLRPNATLLYRVFAIGTDGAGPAAAATAVLPRTSVPRITAVRLTANQGSARWYPPRQEVAVTVQFDQAVTVNTTYGTPQIDLVMGRPPHRQSGYASDYSDGSGTDRLTFRYATVDWHQDLSDIEVGPNALDLNGGRIVNLHATHRASLAHGPATLEVAPQVDARSDAVLVMNTRAPVPAPAAPEAELQIAQYKQSGSPAFAAMLTAASALVAGTELVSQLALAEEREDAEFATSKQVPGVHGSDVLESVETVAVDLGQGVGPRAAAASETPGAPLLWPWEVGQARIDLSWNRTERDKKNNIDILDYLIEVSEDGGTSWTNLLGFDTQGNDVYHPAATRPASTRYSHVGLEPGTTRHYRVKARTSNGVEGPWSTERSFGDNYATTRAMVPAPKCVGAFWSTEITVGSKVVFNQDGYWTNLYGSIADDDFSLGGTDYFVHNAWVADPSQSNPHYHFGVSPAFSDAEREDLTLYVGPLALPLGNTTAGSQQTGYYAHRWTSTEYAETFGYPPVAGTSGPYDQFTEYSIGDKVTVCLVDATPRVTLTLDPASISENDETSTVTAFVSSASDTPFTVTVSAEPDAPAVDGDFSLSTNKVLSFAADATESTGAVTITTVDNDVDTPDKTITVEGGVPGGVPVRAPTEVTLTITDDDAAPELTLEVNPAEIAEGETAIITVATTGTTFVDHQEITLALDSTEADSTDYSVTATTLTLAAGERSVSTEITALDDTVVEGAETITVEASHDSTVIGSKDVTISANDEPEFTVEVSAATIAEGETSEVTVKTGGVTFESDQTIALALSGSATEGAGNDYTIEPAAITIVAGSTSGTATITALDDTVVEGAETITVEASHDSTVIGSKDVTISANDATDFMVEVSAATIAEGETSEVTVKTGGVTFESDQTIALALSGSATEGAGNDYTIEPAAITIVAGSTSGTATITALDDTVVEGAETITVEASHDSTVIGSKDVTISANDATDFMVEVSAATIAEGETSEVTVKTGGVTFESDQTIALALSGSATEGAGNDYTIEPAAITIVAGSTSGTATITALDDTVVEGAETITVEASHDSTVIGSVDVEISANDATDFTVEVSAATIAEGETSEVTVKTGEVTFESDQTIALALSGSATEGASNDYTIEPAAITIVAGSTSGTATITALDDTVVEGAETITVEASHDSTVIGSVDVEISANDGTDFMVEVSAATIAEGETSEVTVKTGGVTFESDQTIALALSGSATEGAGNDYTIAPSAITIVAGSTSGTATITALDDTVVEEAETITVEASHDSTVIGSVDVEISANDATTFTVEVSAATIAEGETSEVTVSTGGVTFESDQTIALALSGSATEGASNDYTIAPAAITIVAGSTSGTATITALDDTVVEGAETITVEASHDSTVIGSVNVEISANDATDFTVEVSASTIAEGETSEVTVKTGGVTFETDQTIALALSGDTTEGAGNDYTIAPSAITIVAGSTSGTATITALDDTVVEEAETITVEASHDSTVIGSVDVEISANDATTFTVEVSAATIAEGETSEVTVSTGGVTFESDETIALALSGSATEGASNDYTIAPAAITIVAGSTSGTATITALDDTVVEGAETITVEASHDSTVIGSVNVEISANDATDFTVEVSASTIAEGETSEVTVKTGGVTFETDQTITLALSGDTTEGAGNDYTIAPSAITIVAGSTSGTATITALDDTVVEGAETITVEASHDSTVIGSVDVEISANDATTFTVEVSAATIAEGETSEVTVSTGGVTFESDETIALALSGSATEGASNDYTIAPAAITIVAGSTSGTATITALDDTVVEGAETITVEASHDSTVIGSVNVEISANDATDFTVEVSASTIAEGETSEVTVKTGGVTFETDQTITLALSAFHHRDTTEGAGNDYTIAPSAITIVAGSTSGTATITALDDTVVEEAETITVEASHDSTVIGSVDVEISANDATTFTVEVSAATIAEGLTETSEVTVKTGGVTFESDQTIALALSGSATEGASNDYTIAPAEITIVAGAMSGTATIAALDETVVEEAETITVEASHDSTVIGSVDVEISASAVTTRPISR